MNRPRYSIIPAGAVTDPRIEGRDLQVLCFLGVYTDKLGWCFLSQTRIAEQLDCGRSTVQRSLARLVDSGWVQFKSSSQSGRPHACHAYRVITDQDDPDTGPSEYEVEDQMTEGGCPPVGTQVPAGGQGCPPMAGHGVPTHTWAHNDLLLLPAAAAAEETRPREQASSPLMSEHDLAAKIAVIAGHDPQFLPPGWMSDGPAMRVKTWLGWGWQPEMMLDMARAMMRRKNDGPPRTIGYFEPGFASAHAKQTTARSEPKVEMNDGQPRDNRASNARQNGRSHSAFAIEFARRSAAASERGG